MLVVLCIVGQSNRPSAGDPKMSFGLVDIAAYSPWGIIVVVSTSPEIDHQVIPRSTSFRCAAESHFSNQSTRGVYVQTHLEPIIEERVLGEPSWSSRMNAWGYLDIIWYALGVWYT